MRRVVTVCDLCGKTVRDESSQGHIPKPPPAASFESFPKAEPVVLRVGGEQMEFCSLACLAEHLALKGV